MGDGGAVLQSERLTYGSAVSYKGSTPTKASTAQYNYTFAGWNPTINSTAIADVDYIAQFDQALRSYTITFQNYDNSVLYSNDFDYGTTPTYSGATPTRPTVDGVQYTFVGWRKVGATANGITAVDGEAIYVAQYSTTSLTYTITVNVQTAGTGSVTPASGTASGTYGTSVNITASPADCYRFVKWNDGDTNANRSVEITGDATYTAIFEKISYTVTVESANPAQGSVSVQVAP